MCLEYINPKGHLPSITYPPNSKPLITGRPSCRREREMCIHPSMYVSECMTYQELSLNLNLPCILKANPVEQLILEMMN